MNNPKQEFMQENVTHSEQLGELMMALSKAQAKISGAAKDKANPYFKSKYADLSSVWEACRDALSSNELAVVQTTEGSKDELFLITLLGHSSGQWIKSRLPLILSKMDPQTMGSCMTYARRYALSAMVGVCPEDDDGEAAMKEARKAPVKVEELPTEGQCEQYFQTWGSEQELFLMFANEICNVRKLSMPAAVAAFMKDENYTKKTFITWQAKRPSSSP